MQNGKYVPPHLRGGASETFSAPTRGLPASGRRERSERPAPFTQEAAAAPQAVNTRWIDQPSAGFPRRDDYPRGPGGPPRRGGGGYSRTRRNEIGFHGDMVPNPRLEERLFSRKDSHTTGINFDKYDDIPVETSEGCPPPIDQFDVELIGEQLMRNLSLCQFAKPTPVQKYSIPIGIAGRDMMACAQTGSGKTAGFLFPVISLLLRQGPPELPATYNPEMSYPAALILAPTRELAVQIYDEALKFCYCTGIRPVVVYGGADIRNQKKELDRGCDIIVATPGRLLDLIQRENIGLEAVRFLVLDEADRMLDMGFEPQIRRIVEEEGMSVDRQTFMFSATFPRNIQRLAGDFMNDYVFLAVGRVGSASKDVIQRIEWVEQHDKLDFLIDFLKRAPEDGLILVFCERKVGADQLEEMLYRHNINAISIHGDKTQREREDALRQFKSGRCTVLVATDVAARGLDIPNVTQVINFDLPSNVEDYVHRIGRTGRVGNVGYALSLMNDKNRNIAKDLADLLIENGQTCERWLLQMTSRGGGGRGSSGGSRGGGGRGNRFGARDARREYTSRPAPAYESRYGPPSHDGYNGAAAYPSHPAAPPPAAQPYGGYPPLGAPSTGRGGSYGHNESHSSGYQDNSAW